MVTALLIALACTGDDPLEVAPLSREALLDPASCAECHPDHYREWSGSMHAYAAVNPIMDAMIALGERETGAPMAADCAPCHAPMAAPLGLLDDLDGLGGLDELPASASGVTCFWCHSASVADDGVLRGGIEDPLFTGAHESAYSSLHDRGEYASVDLCGSCHIETLFEWQSSIFAEGSGTLTCGECHMDGVDGVAAATEGAPGRRVHGHGMPGLSLALTEHPERDAQREGVLDELDSSLLAELCVMPDESVSLVQVTLENIAAGHRWSSSSRDRRAWVEVVAWDSAGAVIWSTGAAGDDQPLSGLDDPELWMIGFQMVDEGGEPVYMPWRAEGFGGETLPPSDLQSNASHVSRAWRIHDALPDRVSLRVRVRPVALDVGAILVEEGELAPEIAAALPTLEVEATHLEWTADLGSACVP